MQTKTSRLAHQAIRVAIAALIVTATLSFGNYASRPVTTAKPVQMVGVATGEIDHGAPVYRLPTVAVTVSRSEALAQIAAEEAKVALK